MSVLFDFSICLKISIIKGKKQNRSLKKKKKKKRNVPSNPERTWSKLKCILLSERSQFGKAIYCMILTI